MDKGLRVADLIKILKTMPRNAIVVSDDGTGWIAEVRECDIVPDNIDDVKYVGIYGGGKST